MCQFAYMQIFDFNLNTSWKPFTSFLKSNSMFNRIVIFYLVYPCKPLVLCDKTVKCTQLYAEIRTQFLKPNKFAF